MSAKTYLVTGATGFVGSYLVKAIKLKHPQSRVVGLSSSGGSESIQVDVLDPRKLNNVISELAPDVVIHLAAYASVTVREGFTPYDINLSGSLNLALAVAKHAPCATVLFASSSEVYGASCLGGAVSETDPPLPLNSYAKSKYLAEQVFHAVLPPTARLIVGRPFNHTGVGQKDDFVLPSFARQVALIEAGQQKTMLVGDLNVRRDFLDVRDVVDAYICLINTSERLPKHFLCNISSGDAHPLSWYVEALKHMSSASFEIDIDINRLRPSQIPISKGDASLLKAITTWRPRRKIESTLEELLFDARRKCRSEGASSCIA